MASIFQVVLYEPDIPHNAGAIARLCVATRSSLHLVGRLGFHLDDRHLKRAGLDYWQFANVSTHESLDACREELGHPPEFLFSAHAKRPYTQAEMAAGSMLVFGSETRGLPGSLVQSDRAFCLPILDSRVRSLNVATVASVVLYEGLRQLGLDSASAG